jgi:hypothetical protein
MTSNTQNLLLLTETQEAAARLNNLNLFMAGPAFPKLPREDKDLFYSQQRAMSKYVQILGKRLERAGHQFTHADSPTKAPTPDKATTEADACAEHVIQAFKAAFGPPQPERKTPTVKALHGLFVGLHRRTLFGKAYHVSEADLCALVPAGKFFLARIGGSSQDGFLFDAYHSRPFDTRDELQAFWLGKALANEPRYRGHWTVLIGKRLD